MVFWDSRSTIFRLLSLTPWRMPGATDEKMATLGQRCPSFSWTAMVLTAWITSGGKRKRLKSRNVKEGLKHYTVKASQPSPEHLEGQGRRELTAGRSGRGD